MQEQKPEFKPGQISVELLKKPIDRPKEPRKPEDEDCCGTGCKNCVWNVYEQKMELYKE